MNNPRRSLSVLLLGWALLLPAVSLAEGEERLAPEALLRHIDEKMSFTSDYKGVIRLYETRKDGAKRAMEVHVYRREADNDLLFLSTKPRYLAGMGTLRIGRNLWDYEATTGSWRRNTQRTNLLNTFTCESDFDRSRLALDYKAVDEGDETVSGVKYRKLLLTATNSQVTFPLLRIWVDPQNNIVKRVGYTSSGRTLRTDIVRSYQRIKDPLSGKHVLHYKEVLETEEQEGTQMVVRYDEVVLAPLDPNIFTKAWLESRLR
ncbi:outer membrane lipoprotein-sorting protein [Myxococcus sp. Y35]|uniref:outer membrane lipoprotein-sorting protein n=1 Tax=Pseudomyxococcus flavus TaxID=3115648 RepID=UPI003CF2C849